MTTTLDVLNPFTSEVIDTVPVSDPDTVVDVVARARAAHRGWSATPLWERVGLMRVLASAIRSNAERLADLLVAEVGKVRAEAIDEVEACARLIEGYANEALHTRWEAVPDDAQPGLAGDLIVVTRESLGVVGGIIPFNFPLDILAHKIGPNLAVGNTVVIKPPEDAPLAITLVAAIAEDVGFPAGVFNVVQGGGATGAALVDADIDGISFTGSAAVGKEIAERRARRLGPTLLELGGNDAAIVLDDADYDVAVSSILDARLVANGQVCCSTKRIIATAGAAGAITERLVSALETVVTGDPDAPGTRIGPLINARAAQRVGEQLQAALGEGAAVVHGSPSPEGTMLSPVVLTGVARGSRIATADEVFAPVFPIIEVDSVDAAIDVANDSPYGLNGSVFSSNVATAGYVAKRLQTGTISINGPGLYRVDAAPFGGFKQSGLGREGFTTSLEELTQPKTINFRGLWS